MTVPAVLFLESVKPLNFVGSQAMVFFAPFVHALFEVRQWDLIQQALEKRETLGWFTDLLEGKEEVEIAADKARKAARKAKRKSG